VEHILLRKEILTALLAGCVWASCDHDFCGLVSVVVTSWVSDLEECYQPAKKFGTLQCPSAGLVHEHHFRLELACNVASS
jgi:hypothetical protein